MRTANGAMQLRRSEEAEADLDEILTYGIMRFGETVGADYFFSFEAAFDLLIRHPDAGVVADHVAPGLRKLVHHQHRIFYIVDADIVRVVRVLHHAMDVDGRF